MTDLQFHAHRWLARMWDVDTEIAQLVMRRQKILDSMSGIGKYDAEHIPAQTGENATESKNIEYSLLTEQIEKRLNALSAENVRTITVIDQVDDTKLRGILKARYINRLTWAQIGKIYHYERSRTDDYRKKALEKVAQFIPTEVVP